MKRFIAALVVATLILPCVALAQSTNMNQVKTTLILDSDLVSGTADAFTSDAIPIGSQSGTSIQGFFSLCWEPASTGDASINYIVSNAENGTYVTPKQVDGTAISEIVASTATVGTGYQCLPGSQFTNGIGLFPWLKLVLLGVNSNPAGETFDAWLIKH